MNPAWKDSTNIEPIVATTFLSSTIPGKIKTLVVFLAQTIIFHIQYIVQDYIPACLLWYCQKHSWSQHLNLQSRASLKILTAICVVTPRVKCLQTVRAIQGWTHPVSQLEKSVMNHQGLMDAVLRIQIQILYQKWADSFFSFFFPLKYANTGSFPWPQSSEKGFCVGTLVTLWHLIWEGSLTWH